MASKVDICNSALIKVGENTITSLDDDTRPARLCNAQYGLLRDELLEEHTWSFAQKRQQLAQNSEAPDFGWTYSHQLPTDFLRMARIWDQNEVPRYPADVKYEIEGDAIYSNQETMKIVYVYKLDNPEKYSPRFISAFAYRLAAELAIPLQQSGRYADGLYKLYQKELSAAKSIDSQNDYPQQLAATLWLQSRL